MCEIGAISTEIYRPENSQTSLVNGWQLAMDKPSFYQNRVRQELPDPNCFVKTALVLYKVKQTRLYRFFSQSAYLIQTIIRVNILCSL